MESEDEITRNNVFKIQINEKLKGIVFLTGIAGIFFISGFISTVSTLKKNNPKLLNKSLIINENNDNTGTKLAIRALSWGTFYSCLSCGIVFYSIWKISGTSSFLDLRQKLKKILPSDSKKNSTL